MIEGKPFAIPIRPWKRLESGPATIHTWARPRGNEPEPYRTVLRSIMTQKLLLMGAGRPEPRRVKLDRACAQAIKDYFLVTDAELTGWRFMGLEVEVVDDPEYLEVTC